jgi:hypothetical protein
MVEKLFGYPGVQMRHRNAALVKERKVHYWSQALFILRATQWLHFLGLLKKPETKAIAFSDLIEDFAAFCSRDRGPSPAAVHNYS